MASNDPTKETLDSIEALFSRLTKPAFNDVGTVLSNAVPQEMDIGNGQIQPVGWLGDGSVTSSAFNDHISPPVPQSVVLTAGFRGFSASWTSVSVFDLAYYEMRWAVDDGSGTAPDTNQWTYARTKATKVYITDLIPSILYWFEVRAVDMANLTATSTTDATAIDSTLNPEAGWTVALSVTPTLVGSGDIAANSITAALIAAGAISADDIQAGTLRISPQASFAKGIMIIDGSGNTLAKWDENGLVISDPAFPSHILVLQGGVLKFSTDAGATFSTAMDANGLYGQAVLQGSLPGGHNVVMNSSFELADFLAAATTATFTDTAGTPAWKAANRFTAPANITEGTELTVTTQTF